MKLVISNLDRLNIYYEIKIRFLNVKKYDKYDDLIKFFCIEFKSLKSVFFVMICYMDSFEFLVYCY